MPDLPCLSFGRMRQAKLTKTSPSTISGRPTGAKSNIWNGLPTASSRTWLTMMLVEVPTSVTKPPSSDMNAMGIRSDAGEVLVLRASRSAVGIRIARAPTFLVGIDNRAVAPARTGTCTAAVFNRDSKGFSNSSITPERDTAAETIRAQAMITTTSLVKPPKAAFAGTIPDSTPASSAHNATMS